VASINGNPSLAVGNAIGSNIANIGLVIGVTALVMPFTVRSQVLLREFPIMFACILLALVLCWDRYLSFADGIILFVGLIGLLGATTWLGTNDKSSDSLGKEMEVHLANGMSSARALTWLIVGLGMLLSGSYMLVDGAVTVATHFGVSDLIIGLTIVAIGTSLPELAASVASALKGEPDIALGNVIGSNMFNILGVVSVPALLHPSPLEPAVMTRDFPVMIGLSIVLLAMATGWRRNGRINRIEGFGLLLAFSAYQCLLYFTS
jgi:cation:H+ antiporter